MKPGTFANVNFIYLFTIVFAFDIDNARTVLFFFCQENSIGWDLFLLSYPVQPV